MNRFASLFLLAALDLARAADDNRPDRGPKDDELTPTVSREDIAAAWRRWAESEPPTPAAGRRGLTLPAPRPGI